MWYPDLHVWLILTLIAVGIGILFFALRLLIRLCLSMVMGRQFSITQASFDVLFLSLMLYASSSMVPAIVDQLLNGRYHEANAQVFEQQLQHKGDHLFGFTLRKIS